jgi:4-amino-4-deoxy-L-arabinose transferase-like glycosyltransferase
MGAGPQPAFRRGRLWLPAVVSLVALARLMALDADPSPSMPDATVMDEALWADAARGKAMLPEGYFADDVGNAYLIAPLYTWLLVGIYQLFGVGLWQTRLLSALASMAIAFLCGKFAGQRLGHTAGALTALLVGICPLLDQHGRFALLESTQAMFLLVTFLLLFPLRPSLLKATLAGACMALAILVKPNSVQFGVAPFATAFLFCWWADARGGVADTRGRLRTALAVISGGGATLCALGLPVWLAHWPEFTATVAHESGNANWRASDHLLRQGLLLSREAEPGRLQVWALLRHAPVCLLGTLLLLMRRAIGIRWASVAGERELWCWLAAAVCIAETSYDHVARREVLFLAPMAFFCARAWLLRGPVPAAELKPFGLFWQWILLGIVPWIALKPSLANLLAKQLETGPDALPGSTGYLAGWWLLLSLLLPAALAAALRLPAAPVIRRVLPLVPWLLTALFAFETLQLGALRPQEKSILKAQQQVTSWLADRDVRSSDVALGEHASLIFQPQRLRTVRRVIPGEAYSSARPNPDAAERLQPRFLVDYSDPSLRKMGDVIDDRFRPIGEVGYLREPSGKWRFLVTIWERR